MRSKLRLAATPPGLRISLQKHIARVLRMWANAAKFDALCKQQKAGQ